MKPVFQNTAFLFLHFKENKTIMEQKELKKKLLVRFQ